MKNVNGGICNEKPKTLNPGININTEPVGAL
jgi:hypothetical protein